MGRPHAAQPVLRLVAAFSRYPDTLAWTARRLEAEWGTVALKSPAFPFTQTDYYAQTMGEDLQKIFFALAEPVDPADLADWKLASNRWEEEYADASPHPEPRPLNIDPGYLTPGKLVLASTKDFAHRIYLRDGIYAETTLIYRHGRWQGHEWTFPDYKSETYHGFFDECRNYLRRRLREAARR